MHSFYYGLAAFSFLKYASAIVDNHGNHILTPIVPSDIGTHRRATATTGLQNQTSLFWGETSNSTSTLVNVTLEAGQEEKILSTDSFRDDLQSITCDNSLSLTFTSSDVYESAVANWHWVNLEDQHAFVIIVNYPGCSTQSGREPWLINGTQLDDAALTVHFTGSQKNWTELNNPYTIEWGQYAQEANTPSRRSFLHPEWDPSFSIDMTYSIPTTLFSKTTSSGLDFSINCNDCGTTGTLTVAGVLKGTLLSLSIDEAYLTATPSGLGANFNPAFEVSGDLTSEWTKDWQIASVPLSEFSVPGIFNAGPELTLSAGFDLSAVQGSATIQAGISATISDSATAEVDFHGSGSQFTGWEPTITTQSPSLSAEVDATLSIYTTVGVDVDISIFDSLSYGFGLEFEVPKVTLKLEAAFDSAGNVCPNSPSDMFGVKFDASIGVDLTIQGWDGDKSDPFFSQSLWNDPDIYSFPEVCVGFLSGPSSAISGIPAATTSAAISSTVANPSTTQAPASSTAAQSSAIASASLSEAASSTVIATPIPSAAESTDIASASQSDAASSTAIATPIPSAAESTDVASASQTYAASSTLAAQSTAIASASETGDAGASSTAAVSSQPSAAQSTEIAPASQTDAASTTLAAESSDIAPASSTQVGPASSTQVAAETSDIAPASSTAIAAQTTDISPASSTQIAPQTSDIAPASSTQIAAESSLVAPASSTEIAAASSSIAPASSTEIAAETTLISPASSTQVAAESTYIASASESTATTDASLQGTSQSVPLTTSSVFTSSYSSNAAATTSTDPPTVTPPPFTSYTSGSQNTKTLSSESALVSSALTSSSILTASASLNGTTSSPSTNVPPPVSMSTFSRYYNTTRSVPTSTVVSPSVVPSSPGSGSDPNSNGPVPSSANPGPGSSPNPNGPASPPANPGSGSSPSPNGPGSPPSAPGSGSSPNPNGPDTSPSVTAKFHNPEPTATQVNGGSPGSPVATVTVYVPTPVADIQPSTVTVYVPTNTGAANGTVQGCGAEQSKRELRGRLRRFAM